MDDSPERLSGSLRVTWTLTTPLLLPSVAVDEGWVGDPRGKTGQRMVTIPGSSLKGAVRSVHEALFNGCLRVIDEDFVPGYRAAAHSETGWTLALVTDHDVGGRPRAFQVCDERELVWVDAVQLAAKWPAKPSLPTSGNVVFIEGDVVESPLDRYEVAEVMSVRRAERRGAGWQEGAQIFLVTDTAARRTTKRNGQPGRCLWASSMLTDRVVAFDPDNDHDARVWRRYQSKVDGTDDRRVMRQRERKGSSEGENSAARKGPTYELVRWRGARIGRRIARNGFLFTGDVIWVKLNPTGDRIDDLRASVIWREPGTGPVSGRLEGHHPCLSREDQGGKLCLTCATFGAADTGGQRRGEGKQESYAGHVRFGSARTSGPAKIRTVEKLAPLGSPKPGSGMFYLDLVPPPQVRARDDLPSRWGGSADPGDRSPLRGRKFYWHSDPDAQAAHWSRELGRPVSPRYVATPSQSTDTPGKPKEMIRKDALLVEAGTRLSADIVFDDLTPDAVAALLAAIDPSRLAELGGRRDARLATHLGGGKPFGFGAATVEVTARITRQRDRYAPRGDVTQWHPAYDSAWLDRIGERAGPAVRTNLPIVLKLLDLDGAGRWVNHVTYPPSAQWRDVGLDGFVKSYAFFMNANGQKLKGRTREWHPLPRASLADPTLPIVDRRT
jgi:CRISPR-associated protein (TIGR03986 family)